MALKYNPLAEMSRAAAQFAIASDKNPWPCLRRGASPEILLVGHSAFKSYHIPAEGTESQADIIREDDQWGGPRDVRDPRD